MGWPGPLTHWQYLVWLAWNNQQSSDEDESLSMDGCVPEETQRRWAGVTGGAKYAMIGAKARSEAKAGVTFSE